MKRHLLPCAAAVAVAVLVLLVLGIDAGTLGVGAVLLLCPLMMLGMMAMMGGGLHRHDRDHDEQGAGRH
jgi:peptidoglycan/LPS O-acetylase OafA/YrhL